MADQGTTRAARPITGTDFIAAQRTNRRNTTVLIAALLLLGAAFGYLLGLAIDAAIHGLEPFDPLMPSQAGFIGAALFSGIGIVASVVALLAGDRVVIRLAGGREIGPRDHPMLHNLVEEMAIASGLPKPRIFIIDTDAPNAFATGMRPERAAIGVTTGLLDMMNREELQGVVAHEMGHIANLDTRYMTAVGILVGLIALVADAIRRSMYYSTRRRGIGNVGHGNLDYGGIGGRGSGRRGINVMLLVLLVFSILAPIAATLVRFAVSRQREFLADATAVGFTRNPRGLITALEKLATAAAPFRGANRATQHMFIVNPFRNFGDRSSALIATHPPLERRIERLQNLGAS